MAAMAKPLRNDPRNQAGGWIFGVLYKAHLISLSSTAGSPPCGTHLHSSAALHFLPAGPGSVVEGGHAKYMVSTGRRPSLDLYASTKHA